MSGITARTSASGSTVKAAKGLPTVLEVGGQRLEVRKLAGNDLEAIPILIQFPTSNI